MISGGSALVTCSTPDGSVSRVIVHWFAWSTQLESPAPRSRDHDRDWNVSGLHSQPPDPAIAPASAILANTSGSRLAPPTSTPSTSGADMSAAALPGFTLPP